MDALYLPDDQAYLRYTSLPGRGPALVYVTGLGIAVAGTYDRCLADPALAEHQTLLVDVFGAGFSDAPETFSYSLEDHDRTIAALPRAIIRGEASGPNRREEELVTAGVRLHVVPRATHGMMWENPDGFVAALKAAFAGAC